MNQESIRPALSVEQLENLFRIQLGASEKIDLGQLESLGEYAFMGNIVISKDFNIYWGGGSHNSICREFGLIEDDGDSYYRGFISRARTSSTGLKISFDGDWQKSETFVAAIEKTLQRALFGKTTNN